MVMAVSAFAALRAARIDPAICLRTD